ncbi:FMN-binding negative transcriptional regulator [Algoriphagus aestuariicola]|uniref:FMN-binding negative transcriptional regulator n=1 Tax=Algoriphagus aestuariicola TaxID=1852016 RepID=A0ABS3BLQ4_9BACT|nr:FMN-binding negative transcriptional regulator [Algoriphagus aestuariicola]MBN7799759.1 FMN-binding negative transcriptional regulator [Algoriphagus aestuariicola]
MYIHPLNAWENEPEVIDFIQKNAFATLVSQVNGRPWATHLPFVFGKNSEGDASLSGHIAKANPQWRSIKDGDEVMVVFQGPHAYISSSWYNHENVPTWNYLAVHVYGEIRIIEGEQLMTHLKTLVDVYESGRPNRVSVETMSESYVQSQVRALVGLEVKITEVHASAKLSQNRDDVNYQNIIKMLDQSPSHLDQEVASEMRKKR